MTYSEYLNKMTVKELTEIAKQMSLTYSGLKKAELIAKLDEYISGWHVIALDMEAEYSKEIARLVEENAALNAETFVLENGIVLTGVNAVYMKGHHKAVKRFNPTMERDRN